MKSNLNETKKKRSFFPSMWKFMFVIMFFAATSSFGQLLNENFEGGFPGGWTTTSNTYYPWTVVNNASGYGVGNNSVLLEFYGISSGSEQLTTIQFAPATSGYYLQFDEAYATYPGNYDDQLQINYSTDSGATFNQLILLDGGDTGPLNTGGDVYNSFVPAPNQWQTLTYTLPLGTNMLQFSGISQYGNNLYLDNIMVVQACSGTPNAGVATSSTTTVCPSSNFVISLSGVSVGVGITYQWQSSTDGVNYYNIPGATSPGLSTNILVNTWYQCIVTCANSLSPATSTPFEMNVNVATLPMVEDFEGTSVTATCWSTSANYSPWKLMLLESSYGVGLHSAYLDFFDMPHPGNEQLTSPVFPATTPGYVLEFDEAYASSDNSLEQLQILYSMDGGLTFTQLDMLDGGDNGILNTGGDEYFFQWMPDVSTWKTFTYPLPVGTTNVQFNGITYGNGHATFITNGNGNNLYLDNIQIKVPTACTGTPNAGTTFSSATNAGIGTYFELSLQNWQNVDGLTYQWQSSTDNINYSNIPGATSNVCNTSGTVSTYYQCVVTCPASGEFSTSVPTFVNITLQYSWTPLTLAPHNNLGNTLLLSDGTVMCKSDGGATIPFQTVGNLWDKLTPDSHGSYANGTWTTLAPMISERWSYSSQVLKDGRVYVAGGEYGTDGTQNGSHAETYDPLTNTWTAAATTGLIISDGNSEILDNGMVLQDYPYYNLSAIYDPTTNTISPTIPTLANSNESYWLKLPDNSILMINTGSTGTERFIPSLNQWIADAPTPVNLYDPWGLELGPAIQLPDGRSLWTGSEGYTSYYTPSGTTAPGTWTLGPQMPNGYGMPDAPAALMPNGKILFACSYGSNSNIEFPLPTYFYEFDYLTNTFTLVNAPNGKGNWNCGSQQWTLMDLPDGNVLACINQDTNSRQYYIYTPSGHQLDAGKPNIAAITPTACDTFLITGTGFNGNSEGSGYGDDNQNATNYPIVRFTAGTNVYYARSYNWNSTGVMRGSMPDTAHFTLPVGIPAGTYSVQVIANGIHSDPVTLTIGLPGPLAAISGNPTPCTVTTQTYSVPPVAGATSYTWTLPIGWTGSSTTNSITVSAINTSGMITVRANNICGSSPVQTLPIMVYQYPGATITANGPVEFCQGSNVTLSTGAFSSYIWSNGGTNSSITVTTGGTFRVTVSNVAGCTGIAQKTTTEVAGPIPTIVGTGIATYCSGNPATLNVATYSSYLWSTGAVTQSVVIPGNSPNTYSVTVTNGFGCTGSSSIVLSDACNIPSSLATTNVARTTAMANWLQPSCDNSYIIRISKHNQNIWTNHTITPNTHYTFSALNVNTMYDWQIETLCNASGTINSGFSPSQTFTTLAREAGDGPNNSEYAFTVYPNPANDHAIVAFTTGTEDNYSIRLIDVTGRIIQNVNYTSVIGENQYQLNLSSVAKGVYTVILQNGTTLLQSKIVVQ